jgi:VWFA-related protein
MLPTFPGRTTRWTAMLLVLLGVSCSAQLRLVIDTLDASQFPTIRAKVKTTLGNSAISGLTIANFTVFEDGRIQAPVTGFCEDTISSEPVSVLLLIDKSNSMGPFFGSNAIVDAKRAASDFVNRLTPADEAALISFSSSPSFDQDWTNNYTLLKTRINAITTNGGTGIWDALVTASSIIRTRTKKRVMILLTDGNDTESNSTFTAALNAVKNSNSILFTIGLGNSVDEPSLKTLARETGGQYYAAPSASQLDAIYAAISREISSSGICELRYQSKLDCLDGSLHTVDITVNYGGGDETARATFRLPTDSSTFSFVSLSMGTNYVVDAGATVRVPVELTRVSSNRPPRSVDFTVRYNASRVMLDSATVTPLTKGWTVTLTPIAGGSKVALRGGAALVTPGPLAILSFSARPVEFSVKDSIFISPPDVQQLCTVASAIDGLISVSGICERALIRSGTPVAKRSALLTATPNPFNPGTWVEFNVGREGRVVLSVHDAAGRRLRALTDDLLKPGNYRTYFDGTALATGVYFLRLEAADATDAKRIVLVK